MSEIERTNEFIEKLIDAEDMIAESVLGLQEQCPIGEAKKRIVGIENNCIITKLDPKEFLKNPYLQNIKIDEWDVGNIYLTNSQYYEEYKTYNFAARTRDVKSLTTVNSLCYFPANVPYPSLGTYWPYAKWMGVEPGEIKTFSSFINEAHGKVLLMGCGLGYVAYMLSIKDNVDEVTIVELDPEVKELFELYLKPQMNSKINIILGDAIKFLEQENLSKYDYCSVDIWHNALDMFPLYLKCLLLEPKHSKTKFHYWLEDDLHIALEAAWIRLLKYVIDNPNPDEKSDIFTEILQAQNIETVEDIRRFLLSPKRPIIQDWALNNPDQANNHEKIELTLLKLQNKIQR